MEDHRLAVRVAIDPLPKHGMRTGGGGTAKDNVDTIGAARSTSARTPPGDEHGTEMHFGEDS